MTCVFCRIVAGEIPAEVKLITWSLVLGVALLGLLVWVSNAFFAP